MPVVLLSPDPGDVPLPVALCRVEARAHLLAGDLPAAERCLEEALRLGGGLPEQELRIRARLAAGDAEGARAALEGLDPLRRAACAAAIAALQGGGPDPSEEALEALARLARNSSDYWFYEAVVHFAGGKDSARDRLSRFLRECRGDWRARVAAEMLRRLEPEAQTCKLCHSCAASQRVRGLPVCDSCGSKWGDDSWLDGVLDGHDPDGARLLPAGVRPSRSRTAGRLSFLEAADVRKRLSKESEGVFRRAHELARARGAACTGTADLIEALLAAQPEQTAAVFSLPPTDILEAARGMESEWSDPESDWSGDLLRALNVATWIGQLRGPPEVRLSPALLAAGALWSRAGRPFPLPGKAASDAGHLGYRSGSGPRSDLEGLLRYEPESLFLRWVLIGSAGGYRATPHAVWMIERHPELPRAGQVFFEVRPDWDPDLWARAAMAWVGHLRAREDARVFHNAAAWFATDEPGLAHGLLRRGQALEPGNPDWDLALGQLWVNRASQAEDEESRREALRQALEHYRRVDESCARKVAVDLALQLGELDLAEPWVREWGCPHDPGAAYHEGQLQLGRLALRRGDVRAALRYLCAAADPPESPFLQVAGPDLTLALELLEVGQTPAVIDFLEGCRRFWPGRHCDRVLRFLSRGQTGLLEQHCRLKSRPAPARWPRGEA